MLGDAGEFWWHCLKFIGVGKSSIITSFTENSFSSTRYKTLGAAFRQK